MDNMDWISPDNRIGKSIIEKGTDDQKPSLFSECKIEITSDNPHLLQFNDRLLIIGDNCDTSYGTLLDSTLQFMSPLELAKITFDDLNLGFVSFKLKLLTCEHKGYIFEWVSSKKLKYAEIYKEKGIHLFKGSEFLAAANRFSIALKLLHSIPVDASITQLETIDNVSWEDIKSIKVKLFDNLAMCESKLVNANEDKIVHLSKKALELNEDDVKALNRLGSISQCRGDIDSAFDYYTKLATVEPNNKVAKHKLNELGYIKDMENKKVDGIYKKMFTNRL